MSTPEQKKSRHDYYVRTRDHSRAVNSAWRSKNRDRHLVMQLEYDREKRRRVLHHYSGGSMSCNCCGESENYFLTLDHINNDGANHRRETRGHTFGWVIRNGFPTGFQVLCMNCNFAKGKYKECPHEARRRNSHGK